MNGKSIGERIGAAVAVFAVFALVVLSMFNFANGPSDQTLYFIDDSNTYYSPRLMKADQRPFAFPMFTDDAVADGFDPLDDSVRAATLQEGLVYVNPTTKKWVVSDLPNNHILVSQITRQELREVEGRRPDPMHRRRGGFTDSCNVFEWLLRKIGIETHRFGPNGEWNW